MKPVNYGKKYTCPLCIEKHRNKHFGERLFTLHGLKIHLSRMHGVHYSALHKVYGEDAMKTLHSPKQVSDTIDNQGQM